jgi:hypothetical protein
MTAVVSARRGTTGTTTAGSDTWVTRHSRVAQLYSP